MLVLKAQNTRRSEPQWVYLTVGDVEIKVKAYHGKGRHSSASVMLAIEADRDKVEIEREFFNEKDTSK